MAGSSVLEHAAMAVATSVGFFLMASMANQIWGRQALLKQLTALQAELARESAKRAADRAGRIRAEQELKQARLTLAGLQAAPQPGSSAPEQQQQQQQQGNSAETTEQQQQQQARPGGAPSPPVYPFRPIGILRSCFSQRNGTPRQPLLVPAARSYLQLSSGLSPDLLLGLQQYSHCWVLYIFHANTDMAKLMSAASGAAGIKSKVAVPRLNGAKMGVLATRTPHRPAPIGLSVAQVVQVQNGVLWLGGADIVDGSPVLDIKPYLPFVDGVPSATAPAWVKDVADDEPLAVGEVVVSPAAQASILGAWQQRQKQQGGDGVVPLYSSTQEFLQLVQQVLSRDIRSLYQRQQAAAGRASTRQNTDRMSGTATSTAAAAAAGEQLQSLRQEGHDAPRDSCCSDHCSSGPSGASQQAAGGLEQQAGSSSSTGALEVQIGRYHVVLDGVDVSYDFDAAGNVVLCSAALHTT